MAMEEIPLLPLYSSSSPDARKPWLLAIDIHSIAYKLMLLSLHGLGDCWIVKNIRTLMPNQKQVQCSVFSCSQCKNFFLTLSSP